MKKIFIIGFCIFNLYSCNNKQRYSSSGDTFSIDSLGKYTINSEIISVLASRDTLRIVTTDNSLFYPLGEYTNFVDIIIANKITIFNFELQHAYNDLALDMDTLYNLKFNKSKIKLFKDPLQNRLQIVSGEITDKEIELTNGIKIGQSKADLISLYFYKLPSDTDRINVIVLESGETGIWHYYTYKDNSIIKIQFDTDYQFIK